MFNAKAVEELERKLEVLTSVDNDDFLYLARLAGLEPDQDFCGADLSGAMLAGLDLTNFNFEGADLLGANLSHAVLDGANLAGARLDRANLSFASLRDTNLRNASCLLTNFHAVDLSKSLTEGMKTGTENSEDEILRAPNKTSPGGMAPVSGSPELQVGAPTGKSLSEVLLGDLVQPQEKQVKVQKARRVLRSAPEYGLRGDPREKLIHWLIDAYVMEMSLVQILGDYARDASAHPEIYRGLSAHLERTEEHSDRLRSLVQRLGGSVSTSLTAMASIRESRSTSPAPDELVKDMVNGYARMHFSIACYRALIVTARALGEQQVTQDCERILRDQEEMARWFEDKLPQSVWRYLGQEAQSAAAGVKGIFWNS